MQRKNTCTYIMCVHVYVCVCVCLGLNDAKLVSAQRVITKKTLLLPLRLSNLLVSLHHSGRRVVLGHTLNTLQHVITSKSHNVLSKFTFRVGPHSQPPWAARGPAGRRLDTPVRHSPRDCTECLAGSHYWLSKDFKFCLCRVRATAGLK